MDGNARTDRWCPEWTLGKDNERVVLAKPAGIDSPLHRVLGADAAAWSAAWDLPERTSGVVLFEPAGRGAGRPSPWEFRYVAALDDVLPRPSGVLSGAPLIRYERVTSQAGRTLVSFQTTVGAAEVLSRAGELGSVVGSEKPWPRATRVLLHLGEARAGDWVWRAPLPAEFSAWLAGSSASVEGSIEAALQRAAPLRLGMEGPAGALRLLSEEGGEAPGISVDQYGDYRVVLVSTERTPKECADIAQCLLDGGARGVYLKRLQRVDLRRRERADLAPAEPVAGSAAPERFVVESGGLRAWVRLADGLSTGLFLDQRARWGAFGASCRGTSLLNLFCYTGMFTVGAARAGATTTSVDLAKSALSRLSQNLELNGLAGPGHRLLPSDAVQWLARAERRGARFDRIVLDPPSFGTHERGVLRLERDLPALLRGALGVAEPVGGRMLCLTHQRGLGDTDFLQLVRLAAKDAGFHGAMAHPVVGGWDAPTLPGVSGTKGVLLSWGGEAVEEAPAAGD